MVTFCYDYSELRYTNFKNPETTRTNEKYFVFDFLTVYFRK